MKAKFSAYLSAPMKAIVYNIYGSPDVLHVQDVTKPQPKTNEVLVKVHAASVNSWDWDMLKGHHFIIRLLSGWFKPKYKILGADVAGVVEAVGTGVTHLKIGDEVFGDIAGAGFGAFAEYVSVPEELLAKKPIALSFELAAALPQAGLLALQGLRYKKPLQKGEHLLINGAGGGVGTIALKYAKSLGATVTCVDKASKFELLRSLGADELIDYTKEDYTKNGKQYDYILDVIAHRSIADYKRALKPGGVFSMIGGSMNGLLLKLALFSTLISKFSGKHLGLMGYRPSREYLEELSQLFIDDKIAIIIDKIYPFEETATAFRYFETGNFIGKIVICIKS